jgi:Fur family ferric uptake transcriptional regulator
MTVSPNVPPLAVNDLVQAAQALRESGLRLSTPRRLVLEALFAANGPVAAGDLARELGIDESSVYRNLEVLEHQGLVRHVHLGHSAGLYTLVTRQEVEYLYCERCAEVITVSPARLDSVRRRIKQEFGFTARFAHFPIVGVCDACAASELQLPRTR